MLLEAFRLVPAEEGGRWSTGGAVLMLVCGAVLIGVAIAPYLPARLRSIVRIGGREDILALREWIGATVLPGLTFLAFGVGFFLREFGYFLIMGAITIGYWFLVVRPSERCRRG
jgi:uncharacterized membrane protein